MRVVSSGRGLLAAACMYVFVSAAACAQSYPAKPIRLVVPAVPGGGTDILARRAAAWLDPVLNQRIVVENIGGAGGDIGTLSVVKAPADGYSLVITNIGDTSIRPHLVRSMPFDPLRDLVPVATMASIPLMVNINAQVPAADLRELIGLAKRQPGKLFFGTPGTGTTLHIAGELFMQMTGTQLVHVPYKGQAPAIIDLIAGRIQIVFTGLNGVKAALEKGTVRALAVTQSRRIKSAPGIPSADEAGLPGYEFVTWYGFAAPRGTPPAVVNLLGRHFNAMLDDAAIQQFLADNGMEPLRHSPESFAALIKTDYDKYDRIIREAGIPKE